MSAKPADEAFIVSMEAILICVGSFGSGEETQASSNPILFPDFFTIKGRRYSRELFFIIQGNFFLLNYIQISTKTSRNHLCWSNFRDFISYTGQNTCKKVYIEFSIWRIAFRSMCITL